MSMILNICHEKATCTKSFVIMSPHQWNISLEMIWYVLLLVHHSYLLSMQQKVRSQLRNTSMWTPPLSGEYLIWFFFVMEAFCQMYNYCAKNSITRQVLYCCVAVPSSSQWSSRHQSQEKQQTSWFQCQTWAKVADDVLASCKFTNCLSLSASRFIVAHSWEEQSTDA